MMETDRKPYAARIVGIVDGLSVEGPMNGWAGLVVNETYLPGVRLEVRRGPGVLRSLVPNGRRSDLTETPIDLAFSLNLAGEADASEMLDGRVCVVAIAPDGHEHVLPIYEPVRAAATETLTALQAAETQAALKQRDVEQQVRSGSVVFEAAASRSSPSRAAKIVFLGAGSTVFAKNLLGDILLEPALSTSRICLYDIDAERLRVSEVVANRIVRTLGVSATVEATTDLGRALDGASYAINMIQVGGYKPCTVTDFDIPNRYGLRQTIGDTLGVGGIMRALRTIPVLLQMTGEMQRRCPDVLHLNYVNPMAMNCRALAEASTIRTIGLCHSVQGTAAELARAIDVPLDEIDYLCAGINHVAFYLRFSRRGEDLYPLIRRVAAEGRVPAHDRVRYDVLNRLGYFVTESSEHFAEYVPWYIKRARPELIQRFAIPLDEYPRRCESQIADWTGLAKVLQDPAQPLQVARSNEYGAQIIQARETGRPVVIYGNVPNDALIDNLPSDACVEVPCLIDGTGLHPVKVGRLPTQLVAVMQTNINVQALTVEAALTGKRDAIYHAAMLDPHTAAELDLDQIRHLVDDMLNAHRPWLPEALFA